MKIKQIEEISPEEVVLHWENGMVERIYGGDAKLILELTALKIGDKYCWESSDGRIVSIVDKIDEEGICFIDEDSGKPWRAMYRGEAIALLEKNNCNDKTAKERVESELDELSLKCRTLENFVYTEKYYDLPYSQQYLLENQLGAMLDYEKCLKARLDCWKD